MNFPITDLYDFLRGPGFVISILIFLTGYIYRVSSLIRATRKILSSSTVTENNQIRTGIHFNGNLLDKFFITFKGKIRNSIFGTNPVMGIISLIFHILLFITPLFLSAHNIIADLTSGFSLFTLPEHLTDIFTIMLIAAGGFFLTRRIFIPHVRIISTFRDYFLILFVSAPFVTGFLAYHHLFNYRTVIYMHMIIGEIAIMVIPFTGLIHMPFVIFSRFFIDSEYSIIHGNRRW